jgi:hypothetical protein
MVAVPTMFGPNAAKGCAIVKLHLEYWVVVSSTNESVRG